MSAASAVIRGKVPTARTHTRQLRPWYQNPSLIAGIVVTGLLVLIAVLAPLIAPHDPLAQDLLNARKGPSAEHWFGTDTLGRDIASRLIWGARVNLRIGFLAVLIPFVFGTMVGAIAGYFGGWFDILIMRIVDIFFALPFYVIVIALVFALGAGEASIYLAIAIVSWVAYAKIVRGEVMVARQLDYVRGARLGGLPTWRVLVRHIGPNVLSQVIVYAMSDIVMDILAVVTLGYLGLGITPPTAEWGGMIVEGQTFITTNWLMATIPGLAVVVTSLGLSWLGDGLSDLLNPDRRK
ncbi:ABC transporter permease [Micromonospora cremea]|uniref:Peptide/nickel transport system permease protein n=1 Tax=Micromonospora cremea TaxID=709881 RepID=A0A1N5TDY3_9ACTN|nr:ABC transporter permease [Micromonospora cremea]SIM46279.1 peptide/nickel transport system permease protein [Micromonospora cremea]